MNSEETQQMVSITAGGRRDLKIKVAWAVWLLAGSLWLAGGVNLQAAALLWEGANNVNNVWDVNTTANWNMTLTKFNNGDSVTFNNNGFASPTVNVVGLVQPAAMTVDTSSGINYAFTNATGSIIGTGGVLLFGVGKLTMSTTNAYSGGTTVSNALLQLNSGTAAGTGPITNSSGTVYVNFGGLPNSLACFGTATYTNSGHTGNIGTLNGSGTLMINSPGQVFDLVGNITGYGGTFVLSNCTSGVRFNGTTGSSLATFDLGAGTEGILVRNNGTSFAIGALTGGSSTTLAGNNSYAQTSIFSIGGNNQNTTFNGAVTDGSKTPAPTAIIKVGSGTLTLAGNVTCSGSTTVSNGVLALTGSTSLTNSPMLDVVSGGILDVSGTTSGILTLSSNQTLTGGGTIRGSVSAPTNTTILPGDGVGVLTVTNVVTLAGALVMELNNSQATVTNDQITAATINYGGTLTVTNLGPALAAGQSFRLFSGVRNGAFAAVALPTNGTGGLTYTWTNKLTVDGSIQVLAVSGGVNTNSTVLTNLVSGTNLVLSWPTDHIGWRLLVQTNNLAAGVSSNTNDWGTVANSSFTNQVTQPVDAAKPSEFYRLVYP